MSRQRRNFSAKFKSDLVIELLKGEKDLNTLAAENNIQPNLLRNWKKEFLDKASLVFDDKREDNLKEKLAEERKEKAEYAKKVGQLTMQVDWLKKKSEEISEPIARAISRPLNHFTIPRETVIPAISTPQPKIIKPIPFRI